MSEGVPPVILFIFDDDYPDQYVVVIDCQYLVVIGMVAVITVVIQNGDAICICVMNGCEKNSLCMKQGWASHM